MTSFRAPRSGFAAVLVAALLAFAWPQAARAQVSPGPLAAPHAALEGTTQCFQCHASGSSKTGMDSRCLACHQEIDWMRARKRGYHTTVAARECASCHPDHGGRDFQMIVWDGGAPEKFDHRKAGYVLQGKHATLECRACHKPANQKSAAVPLLRRKNHADSWLGLETACASCHADPHRGQLGAYCASCHAPTGWKPAAGFDHAKSAFPLTGAHAKVECARCHATPQVATTLDAKGQPVPQWKPLPHGDCVSCHKDPHAGRFPGACAKCHVTTDWHQVGKQGFNHDLTRYPLHGRHATVACASCHDPKKAWGEKPKFARCDDCHHDAHAGKATLRGAAADCAACHAVDGFERPAYTVAQHATSAYPLTGRHAAAACAKCHVTLPEGPAAAAWGTSRVVLRPSAQDCVPCHADPHRGRFAAGGTRPHPKGCADCHDVRAFVPSHYDGVRHADCVFPLRGAHRAVTCQACHQELKAAPSGLSLAADSSRVRLLPFEGGKRACTDCHGTPHGTQFAHRKDRGACEGCHDENAFSPASRFDHNRDSQYRLEGAHLRAACAGCHVPHEDAAGRRVVTYRPTPAKCEACHAGGVRDTSGTAPKAPKTSSMRWLGPAAPETFLTAREAGHASDY